MNMEETDKYLDAFRTTLPVLIDKEMNKVRKQQRGLILLVCVLLATNLLLLGGTLWVLQAPKPAVPEEVSAATEVVAIEETEEPEEAEEAAPVFTAETVAEPETAPEKTAEDSDPLMAAAERAAELAVERSRAENQVKRADAVAAVQKKDRPQIPDDIITERGMTLRSLARRYYGHEVFWVCIYDRNIEVLSSPDVLPLGIRLYLPRPADYGIDANDPSSLQQARKLGRSLME